MLYLFDIDGTLSNLEHRLHYIQQEPADWNSFYQAAGADSAIFEVITVARALGDSGHLILAPTGRSETIRGITAEWLRKYRVPVHRLYMRKDGDHRDDSVVKAEMLAQIIADFPNHKIGGVFEDRQSVVDMWRGKGLKVFQVAEGKF